jgi:hemerythrin
MQYLQIGIKDLLLNWRVQYQVGDLSVDRQHQEMFKLFNNLCALFIEQESNEVILPVIEEFIGCAKQHFADEEQLMERIDFLNRQEHKLKHEELLLEISRVAAEIHEGKQLLSAGLLVFLREWILIHILSEDMQFKPYLD